MTLGGPYKQEVEQQWQQWLDDDIAFIAPPLFGFEVTSTVWQQVYHRRLSLKQGQSIFEDIFNQGICFEYPPDLHVKAWNVAERFHLHAAYDAHYVALAEHFNCEFWTMDQRLYNSIHSELPWVRTVAE